VLPDEARRAAWDALWRRLLQPVADDAAATDDFDADDATEEHSPAA
jgi:hypothetical protein